MGYGKVGEERVDENGDIYIWQDYNGWHYTGNVNEQTDNDDGGEDEGEDRDFGDVFIDYLEAAADVFVEIFPFIFG